MSLLGSTPVSWFAERQSSCLTSTFGIELTSSKKAVEEAIAIRHCCRAFGMRVSRPTIICEDSMAAVVSSANPGSTLQHESMALSHRFVRESAHGDVVESRKIGSEESMSDALTKGLESSAFSDCMMPEMSD